MELKLKHSHVAVFVQMRAQKAPIAIYASNFQSIAVKITHRLLKYVIVVNERVGSSSALTLVRFVQDY